MASRLDPIAKAPPLQLALVWILVAGLIVGGWWFLYYGDAVDAKAQAEQSLIKARADLAAVEEKRDNYDRELKKRQAQQQEVAEKLQRLPASVAAVDHLMRKIQQQSRLVGVDIVEWKPEREQRLDGYAKLPVRVRAVGTWHQFGELFRRSAEMGQFVNVEGLSLRVVDARADDGPSASPRLEASFTAATFRFLDPSAPTGGT